MHEQEPREKKLVVVCKEACNAEFEIWLHWIYTGDLVLDEDSYITLISLYILGDHLKDAEFRNIVIDELLRVNARVGYIPGFKTITKALKHLKSNSMLRLLLLRMVAFAFKTNDIEDLRTSCSHELCCAVLQEIVQSGLVDPNSEPELSKRCEYHVHEDGSKCQGA